SPFAARFRELVGEPPLTYVTRWRIQSAATLLGDGSLTLAEIAEGVGYESLPAFSKAFKRWTGESPSSWRRRRRPRSLSPPVLILPLEVSEQGSSALRVVDKV